MYFWIYFAYGLTTVVLGGYGSYLAIKRKRLVNELNNLKNQHLFKNGE